MKTDGLICVMVQDEVARPSLAARMVVALIIGGSVAAAMFAFGLGVRPDIDGALQTWRFVAKVVIALTCFTFALWACMRLAQPDADVRKVLAGLAIGPVLLIVAVSYELTVIPSDAWLGHAIGSNSRICLVAVPLLSIAPFAAVLTALRAGAPSSPSMGGAVAGLLAGALAATLYATHCTDDSPLFVALWYTPAVLLVTLAGAVAGQRVLRW